MNDEKFSELLASVKQADLIIKGSVEPDRLTEYHTPQDRDLSEECSQAEEITPSSRSQKS